MSEAQIIFCDLKKTTLRTYRTKSNTKICRIIFLADFNHFLLFVIDLLQMRSDTKMPEEHYFLCGKVPF